MSYQKEIVEIVFISKMNSIKMQIYIYMQILLMILFRNIKLRCVIKNAIFFQERIFDDSIREV